MRTNEELQKDVLAAMKWEPLLKAAQIGVTVLDGVVTLTGTVDSFAKKSEAEHAATNVAGVKAVVEKLEISFSNWGKTEDGQIAQEVVNALKWNWQIPNDRIKVKVESGWVTLDGELNWNYQKEAAMDAVKNLVGVKGVINTIKIKSETRDAVEKIEIEKALARNWSINADDIKVSVSGNKVTLTGMVTSWYQKNEAEKIAFKAPGVWSVANDLLVEYKYSYVD